MTYYFNCVAKGLYSPHEHVARLATIAPPTNAQITESPYCYC